MKTTAYFDTSVLARRPYLRMDWIEAVLVDPIATVIQPNGRVCRWRFIPELGKYPRVVTEPDGGTVHNAFPDRGFRPRRTESSE